MDKIQDLVKNQDGYNDESKEFIKSLSFAKQEIDTINIMKNTEGWKLIEKKIREELHQRINELVKDDLKIQTLLALLVVADTKSMSRTLQEEIDKILPE